ncbi:MAG: class I poly(R)-hydroxyalkanoic acid synthase [Sphingomonadales bacterium]|nr:class I poly(R)-hydroxyalkanoic acid synthase [Sphingomonadales bacterium]
MADDSGTTAGPESPEDLQQGLTQFSENMAKIAERSQKLVTEYLARHATEAGLADPDPLNISGTFMELTARMMADPAKLAQHQMEMWQDYVNLWQNTALRMMGGAAEPVIEPGRKDRRFHHEAWRENQVFDYIKQSYLLAAKHINKAVSEVEGLDEKEAAKADFFTRQFVDALSPSNFVLTNPEVLKATVESKGENLVNGLENMLNDFERGGGQLAISMTDRTAFEVGGNVATTPGKVVFENRMFQLIQYAPTTETVYATPLLIFPPWINKFYILDLTEKKSLIRWAVAQGYTVFVVSWVNPDETYRDTSFEDYMLEGLLTALGVTLDITGEQSANVIGYCIAGTLLAASLAYLEAKGEAARVKSATFLTAQVDFTEAGELQVFIDEEQLQHIEKLMAEKGYLDAKNMAVTFNMLRSNDLIWSFVVNNYLMGKEPFPFDLLYWNEDSTRLPAAMHSYYLRNMYQENLLVKPGGLTLGGEPIDLSTVKTPMYIQAGKEDHIAPPNSVFKMLSTFSGPMKYVLAGSGHIAGVVNPPAAKKYQYWTNSKKASTLSKWIAGAEEHPGSWWPDWHNWLKRKSGKKAPAREPGAHKKYPAIEDAPGRYVKVKA